MHAGKRTQKWKAASPVVQSSQFLSMAVMSAVMRGKTKQEKRYLRESLNRRYMHGSANMNGVTP